MKFGIRELVFFVTMVGLLACTYLFIFKPRNEKRLALLADIDSKTKIMGNLQQATSGITDLNNKLAELQQAISFFESKLPAEKEMDKILKEVWQMAAANNLQTRQVKTMHSEHGTSYSEQPIQMSLSGDFKGYYSFLLQLEKLQRITRVGQMTLTKINDRNGDMQAQMTLSIFFEPESAAKMATTN
jgi:type IV pilus assembly protein PilO